MFRFESIDVVWFTKFDNPSLGLDVAVHLVELTHGVFADGACLLEVLTMYLSTLGYHHSVLTLSVQSRCNLFEMHFLISSRVDALSLCQEVGLRTVWVVE